MLEKTYDLNVFDFIKKICEFEIQLVLPEVQRPLAWPETKIRKIFSNKESEYFGHILLKQNKVNEFQLIDGQQRMSVFMLAYNIAEGINGKKCILESKYLNDEERKSFRKIYGPKGIGGEFDPEEFKKIEENIGAYGYIDNFDLIKKTDKTTIIEKLKNTFISFSLVPDGISEYDVFISMNYEGVSLAQSDILKAFFIKSLLDQSKPTNIKKPWQRMISQSAKSNVDLDELIVRYLSTETKGMNKKKFVNYYKNKVIKKYESISDNQNKVKVFDEFIESTANKISVFVEGYSKAAMFKEEKSKITTKKEDFYNSLVKFSLTSGLIYKPYITLILEYRKSTKDDPDKLREFISFLLISFYMHELNKTSKQNPQKHYDFLMGNKFRNNIENLFQEYNLQKYNWKLFSIPYNSGNEKEIYLQKDIWNNVFFSIAKKTKDSSYGKTLRLIFEWYFNSNQGIDFFEFKNNLSLEHVEENLIIKKNKKNILISKKNLSHEKVVFLEHELHKKINKKIKDVKLNAQNTKMSKSEILLKVSSIKSSAYKKSSNTFTKKFLEPEKYTDKFVDFLNQNWDQTMLYKELHKINFNFENYKKQIKK